MRDGSRRDFVEARAIFAYPRHRPAVDVRVCLVRRPVTVRARLTAGLCGAYRCPARIR